MSTQFLDAVSIFSTADVAVTDAGTTNFPTVLTVAHNSSGTPAANFGAASTVALKSSTTPGTSASASVTLWVVATHGSRRARQLDYVYDTAAREVIAREASGSAAMLGFLGATPSARLVSPDAGTALVTFGLASGTPTFALANLTGAGTGVLTFLATPSSANLASAVTDETGSGLLVFATSPTLTTPLLGTPTSGVLTNCTGYPASALVGTQTKAYLNADQTGLSYPAWNTINIDTEVVDTLSEYNTGTYTFTPAATGEYLITARVSLDPAVTIIRAVLSIWVGTSSEHERIGYCGTATVSATVIGAQMVTLTGGTGYTLRVFLDQASGTNYARGGSAYTIINIRRIY